MIMKTDFCLAIFPEALICFMGEEGQENPSDAAVEKAKQAAILKTNRTVTRHIDYDPAGSTYEIDWTDEVKEWAKLCGLDLEKYDPPIP